VSSLIFAVKPKRLDPIRNEIRSSRTVHLLVLKGFADQFTMHVMNRMKSEYVCQLRLVTGLAFTAHVVL